jgi:HAD superfamily hydrolase (TIGR01509 family)
VTFSPYSDDWQLNGVFCNPQATLRDAFINTFNIKDACMQPDLLIFDFDGVVADSESLSNALLAEALTAYGLPTSTEDAMRRYMGRRWSDCIALITEDFGGQLPATFEDDLRSVTRVRMRAEVKPVPGIAEFLKSHTHAPHCIASSSSPEWLADMTRKFGLDAHFGGNLFSATAVARGKPAPDIFLYAARGMRIEPGERCIVIEDSAAGVQGARAAGMLTIGFCGGSHIRPGHEAKLHAAGADHVASSWPDVARVIAAL